MASIIVTYKGLTGSLGTVTIDDTLTLGALIVAIASDEGLQTDYYAISVENNPAVNDTVYDDSTVTIGGTLPSGAGITADTRIICTPRQDGTKERRQIQKLDIAAVKRSDTYDITQLPTQYSGNDIVDNPNIGGLVDRRPWNTP